MAINIVKDIVFSFFIVRNLRQREVIRMTGKEKDSPPPRPTEVARKSSSHSAATNSAKPHENSTEKATGKPQNKGE